MPSLFTIPCRARDVMEDGDEDAMSDEDMFTAYVRHLFFVSIS